MKFFKMAISNTSFNLHAFSMEGWLPSPHPVTLTVYPTPEVRGMHDHSKMTAKDGVMITLILYQVNLGVLVQHHENW